MFKFINDDVVSIFLIGLSYKLIALRELNVKHEAFNMILFVSS